ncbi:MAG: hypothetical protein IJJ86_06690 [Clostridia bacterium]|nr:hypothetical protein [Clostridia bacterium]
MQRKESLPAEEQTVTVTVRSKGEPCALSDAQIQAWYAERIAALFDPKWGAPEITVSVERKRTQKNDV